MASTMGSRRGEDKWKKIWIYFKGIDGRIYRLSCIVEGEGKEKGHSKFLKILKLFGLFT